MKFVAAHRLVVFAAFILSTSLYAQASADQATLNDLKLASKQMSLEAEGTPSFRLNATYEAFDFLGRPESQGRWTEEFGRPDALRREVHDSNAPENYAPEDQANIGAAAPTTGGTFVQRFLIDALLHPGPTDRALEEDKVSFKVQKVGTIALRCVVLEPREKSKNPYLQRMASRAYCLAQDAPIIRLVQGAYGMVVTYNSIARFGSHTLAQQVTAQQRGHVRGKLQVTKLVAAPELATAALPKVTTDSVIDSDHSGATKIGPGEVAGQILSKVAPVYPLESKMKHISGTVLLHQVISKEGTIESLEVISAPSDDLAEAAVEAVSQWRYKPYVRNGAPTEVDTTVTVNFSIR